VKLDVKTAGVRGPDDDGVLAEGRACEAESCANNGEGRPGDRPDREKIFSYAAAATTSMASRPAKRRSWRTPEPPHVSQRS
jgi:hypothetical protein